VGGRGRDIRRGRHRRDAPGRRLRVEEQDPRYWEKPFLWGLLSILGVHRCSGLARALEISRPATKVCHSPVRHRGPVDLAWLDCWLRERSEAHGREPECCHDPASALLRPLVWGNVERQLAVWVRGDPIARRGALFVAAWAGAAGQLQREKARGSCRPLPVGVSCTDIVTSGRSSGPTRAAEVLTAAGVMAGSCLWPAATRRMIRPARWASWCSRSGRRRLPLGLRQR
jgi:hypothetical protein